MPVLPIPANARWKIEQNDSTGLWMLTRRDPTTQTWVLLAERYVTQADSIYSDSSYRGTGKIHGEIAPEAGHANRRNSDS
jgi:hypothetical protein